MPVKRAQRDGFGTAEDKNRTVDSWLEGAMVALTCGKVRRFSSLHFESKTLTRSSQFMDNPSVESVRAVSVLATYFVFCSSGESSGAGMGLLSLVVQVAMSLGLHRDPDRMPGKFTFFEVCYLSATSLGSCADHLVSLSRRPNRVVVCSGVSSVFASSLRLRSEGPGLSSTSTVWTRSCHSTVTIMRSWRRRQVRFKRAQE